MYENVRRLSIARHQHQGTDDDYLTLLDQNVQSEDSNHGRGDTTYLAPKEIYLDIPRPLYN